MTDTKWCPRCEEDLPVTEFGVDRRNTLSGGLRSWCRPCVAESWQHGGGAMAPTFQDRYRAASVMVCQCDVAVIEPGQAGACECGFPIVALMAERPQEIMDARWPQWRAQPVVTAAEQVMA